MRIKKNEIKVIANIVLKLSYRGEYTEIYLEGLATFTIKHNESVIIDYDYLRYQTEKIEEHLLNNSLNSIDKTLYDVRLDVEQWEIGEMIYKVKNHEEKKLEKFSKYAETL